MSIYTHTHIYIFLLSAIFITFKLSEGESCLDFVFLLSVDLYLGGLLSYTS